MGLLILPFILIAFVIYTISLVLSIKRIVKRQIGIKDFLLGILAAVTFYGIILICYKIAGSAWALSTGFIMPICLFIIPFSIYLITKSRENKLLSSILLISIVVSGCFSILFYDAYFDFFDYLGVEKIY